MARYAAGTDVSSDRSVMEIKRTLQRYGASQFVFMESESQGVIAFVSGGRQVRFVVPLPDPASREFTVTPTGKARVESAAFSAWEQACRQRWRALALVVKAKLEAVDAGIVSFEEEFMAHLVLPGGQTVFERVGPQIAAGSSDVRLEIESRGGDRG